MVDDHGVDDQALEELLDKIERNLDHGEDCSQASLSTRGSGMKENPLKKELVAIVICQLASLL